VADPNAEGLWFEWRSWAYAEILRGLLSLFNGFSQIQLTEPCRDRCARPDIRRARGPER
jgi:hypothetical protein